MEPLLTLFWIIVAFGVWYLLTQHRGKGPGAGGRTIRGGGVRIGQSRPNPSARRETGRKPRTRETRLRAVEGSRAGPAKIGRAGAEVRAIDDPVTALATLALVLTGEDLTPTRDVHKTLQDRLSGLTDEVHVARAMQTATRAARASENPHAVIKELTPVFERTLTPRERADVVAVCEDVISANGIISDHQSVWLRSLRRSLGFEVKG